MLKNLGRLCNRYEEFNAKKNFRDTISDNWNKRIIFARVAGNSFFDCGDLFTWLK